MIAPDNPDLSARYVATWTPTLIVLDAEGREHYRTVGYLPAQDYIARMQLARAKTAYDLGNYAQAIQLCQEVAQQYTGTEAAPEALYWLGVAQYKSTGDVAPLKEAWKTIWDKYPQSEWAKKVSFVFE